MPKTFDAIVIGAGQSGPFLAVRLAQAGQKVALIEREHLGGTCVNDGCIPTKTLIASARAAQVARRAGDFGVLTGPVSVDMAAIKARKDAVVAESVENLGDWIGKTENLTLIWGDASFTGPKTIVVGAETYTAEQIFINVGGRASVPDWPGLAEVPYLTNTSMMGVDRLPEHLIIAGGSYIGLEFAQMYRRFGAEVTLVEYADRLISREDPDICDLAKSILEKEGVRVILGARDFAVARQGETIRLSITAAGRPVTVEGSYLLLAVGRKPNTDTLGLDTAGIATDKHGYITVDDQLRTTAPGVWASGDVNGKGAFTHTSYNDYEILAANLLDNDPRRVSDRISAYALYIDPPLARIGMGEAEAEAKASGRKVLRGLMPMTRVGRARERSETEGFMKVLVDADTKRILGAALFGIEADEVIHSLLDIMYADAPYTVIQRAMHIHPTVSELIPTLLADLQPLQP
jgi:pyruvate/2-oxoglutarate dehydrogenase complex dihydrolipoamide dehydrogenase (E3) component